jgi:hypothetical protein
MDTQSINKIIRIGNASGFWGDEPTALRQQLSGGSLDYIVSDYLAEVSMSILAKQQVKNPEAGYITDFINHLSLAKDFLSGPAKIITNAGGNNPRGCAIAICSKLKEWGIIKKVMAVEGDNLFPEINQLMQQGNSFDNLETGAPFSDIKDKLVTANVYTSSEGILKALEQGADIVITGRASDSALTIGPLRFEFGWAATNYAMLGAGMIAGHIIECGAQVTGGNFTDWETVPGMDTIGFPIIEMNKDGSFIVTKHPGTGGMVTVNTVKEQLVYEIGDPEKYSGPDTTADLSYVKIVQVAKDKVKVTGCNGTPPPDTWKVSMAFVDGYKAVGGLMLSGPETLAKANQLKDVFWKKLGLSFRKTATQFVGFNSVHTGFLMPVEPNELLVQFTAFDEDKSKLEAFSKQIAAMILVGPQGLAAIGGRPGIQEVVRYWPSLVRSKDITFSLYEIDGTDHPANISKFSPSIPETINPGNPAKKVSQNVPFKEDQGSTQKVKLKTLCLARSGDKGNTVNIGVIARSEIIYHYLYETLTPGQLEEWFHNVCAGTITRYELPTLSAFNFLLTEALDGGGTYSGRMDPQGKTFAAALLDHEIIVPSSILTSLK